jgi:hypothetical protein
MLDKKIEQRINCKFGVKLKKTATETFSLLRDVYGEDGRGTYSTVTKLLQEML